MSFFDFFKRKLKPGDLPGTGYQPKPSTGKHVTPPPRYPDEGGVSGQMRYGIPPDAYSTPPIPKKELTMPGNTYKETVFKGMTIEEILIAANIPYDLDEPCEQSYGVILLKEMNHFKPDIIDTLTAAYKHGPLFDGDVPSKTARDLLLSKRMIAKVVVKGEDGYNACTHRGRDAYKILQIVKNVVNEEKAQQATKTQTT